MRKLLSILGLIACGAAGSAPAADVTSIGLCYKDGATVAVINVDGPIRFTHEAVEAKEGKPFRVVVDVLSAVPKLRAREFQSLPACAVKSIRTSQYSVKPEPVVRLVFDLNKETVYRADSDTKAIYLYFMDKGVTKFADWSSLPTATSPKTEAKAGQRAAKPEVPGAAVLAKSATGINKSIETDRLASLEGKTSPAAKPAVAGKTEPAKPETKPRAADKSQLPSADAQNVGVGKVESKAVEPPRPTSVIQAEPAKPAAKQPPVQAQTDELPRSLQGGFFTPARETPATATEPNKPAPKSESPVSKSVVAAAPKVESLKGEAKDQAAIAQKAAETKIQGPASKPTSQPTATPPAVAAKSEEPAETKPASTLPKSATASLPESVDKSNEALPAVVAQEKAPFGPTATEKSPVATPAPTPSTGLITTTPGQPLQEAAAPKGLVGSEKADSEMVSKEAAKPADVTGEVDISQMADAENEAAADAKSTSRFRRSPTGPTKLKGTLVAEFPGRLVIKYKTDALRDPFETLINEARTFNDIMQKRVPDVEGLRLVGIIESVEGENRALFEDKDDYGYILAAGDKVQKGYVLRVESDRVYFQIFEYGWSRTVALNIEEE